MSLFINKGESLMPNFQNDPVVSVTDDTNTPAVQGVSSMRKGIGISGRSTHAAGVLGESAEFNGVLGVTTANGHAGVAGVCDTSKGNGVYGRSKQANGVIGFSSSDGSAGVAGANDEGNGNGVYGRSAKSDGVAGVTTGDGKAGVAGVCETGNGNGVYGRSKGANGVVGSSSSDVHAGVAGVNDNSAGVGIYGKGGRLAGLFEGKVEITESLIVQGIDVVGLLHRLQQLEPILAELEAARAARSIISVQQVTQAQGGGARFMITGEHFRAFATVKINVHSNTTAGALGVGNTDGQGKLNTFLEIRCSPGTVLIITAFDENIQQTSNTETITCT
jgi:hypothetical protein